MFFKSKNKKNTKLSDLTRFYEICENFRLNHLELKYSQDYKMPKEAADWHHSDLNLSKDQKQAITILAAEYKIKHPITLNIKSADAYDYYIIEAIFNAMNKRANKARKKHDKNPRHVNVTQIKQINDAVITQEMMIVIKRHVIYDHLLLDADDKQIRQIDKLIPHGPYFAQAVQEDIKNNFMQLSVEVGINTKNYPGFNELIRRAVDYVCFGDHKGEFTYLQILHGLMYAEAHEQDIWLHMPYPKITAVIKDADRFEKKLKHYI